MPFPDNLLAWMKDVDVRLDLLQKGLELNDIAIAKLIVIVETKLTSQEASKN